MAEVLAEVLAELLKFVTDRIDAREAKARSDLAGYAVDPSFGRVERRELDRCATDRELVAIARELLSEGDIRGGQMLRALAKVDADHPDYP